MIGSIRHKALRNYWTKGQTKGRRIMAALEAAGRPEEMSYPGSYFHPLKGDRAGRYAVRLTAERRMWTWRTITDDQEAPIDRPGASGGDPARGRPTGASDEQDGRTLTLGLA